MAESFVEGTLEHDTAMDEEIGGVEMLIGGALTLGSRVMGGFGLLVLVTEIAFEGDAVASDGDTSIDDGGFEELAVSTDELIAEHGHVAINKKEVGVMGLAYQEIAYGSASDILGPDDVTATGNIVDGFVDADFG